MPTLGEFHTLVAAEANKGTRLAAIIPGWVRRAATWLERNYSFTYMDRHVSFVLDPNASEPRIAPIDGTVKSLNFIKRLDVDNPLRRYDLERVAPQDTDLIEEGPPTQYWLDGHQWLWFNRVPNVIYTFHMSYVAYSAWPVGAADEHWLLDYAEDALLAKTMLLMAPGQREPEWLQTYAGMYAEGLQTAITADSELKYHNVKAFMQYKPDFIDDPRLG